MNFARKIWVSLFPTSDQAIEADVKREDILAKTIIAEEATVRKAGGKFKMNPLFPSTTGKIKAVRNLKHLEELKLSYCRCSNKTSRYAMAHGLPPRLN